MKIQKALYEIADAPKLAPEIRSALAARIEDHMNLAGNPVLIDRNTREGLSDSLRSESLGEMLFKGKRATDPYFFGSRIIGFVADVAI